MLREEAIMDDSAQAIERLREINLLVNAAENDGEVEVIAGHLASELVEGGRRAPLLAIRRARGLCEGAGAFLGKVQRGGDRKIDRDAIDVQLIGRFRALVRCVVTSQDKRYDNLRIFVREDAGKQDWKLLAWANEEIGS
jgi:hypothetical protein